MLDHNDTPTDDTVVWRGVLDPSHLVDDVVSASHRLADAAKAGDWSTVFSLLDDPGQRVDINWWRPGGTAWFTVLHQAAWHGAPTDVAAALIRRGALRSLTDSRGRTAHDIRCERDLKNNSPKGIAAQQLWFPVPGMYGGFHITLLQDCLDVKSWCRVVGGSGQTHLITREGAILVDEGFV